jgi:hypothetical protein
MDKVISPKVSFKGFIISSCDDSVPDGSRWADKGLSRSRLMFSQRLCNHKGSEISGPIGSGEACADVE